MGGNHFSRLLILSDTVYPCFGVSFTDADSFREGLRIDVDEFIGVKSFKAKGKRISTYKIGEIVELEPIREPQVKDEGSEQGTYIASDNEEDDDKGLTDGVISKDDNQKHVVVQISKDESESKTSDVDENDVDEITGQMSLF